MPNVSENNCKLFADDTKLIAIIKEDLNQLQIAIDALVAW